MLDNKVNIYYPGAPVSGSVNKASEFRDPQLSYDIHTYHVSKVFAFLQYQVPSLLTSETQNKNIVFLMQNEFVGKFDDSVFKDVTNVKFIREEDRITSLINIFHNRPKDVVLEFLHVLMNMKGHEHVSAQIRQALNQNFPNIVETIQNDATKSNNSSDTFPYSSTIIKTEKMECGTTKVISQNTSTTSQLHSDVENASNIRQQNGRESSSAAVYIQNDFLNHFCCKKPNASDKRRKPYLPATLVFVVVAVAICTATAIYFWRGDQNATNTSTEKSVATQLSQNNSQHVDSNTVDQPVEENNGQRHSDRKPNKVLNPSFTTSEVRVPTSASIDQPEASTNDYETEQQEDSWEWDFGGYLDRSRKTFQRSFGQSANQFRVGISLFSNNSDKYERYRK